MKSILLTGIIFLSICTISCAQDNSVVFINDAILEKWMTSYYLNPKPEQLGDAIIYFCGSKVEKDTTKLPMMSFFVAALENHESEMQNIFNNIAKRSVIEEKVFFLDVLWLINSEKSRDLINKASKEWKESEVAVKISDQEKSAPYNVRNISAISPQILDLWWYSFFATGDDVFIKKIIDALSFLEDRDFQKRLTGEAAKWSLTSNADQHKRVREICVFEEANRSGVIKKALGDVISGKMTVNAVIADGRDALKNYKEAIMNLRAIEQYFTGEPIYQSKDEKLKNDLRNKISSIISAMENYIAIDPNNAEATFYLGKTCSMAHDLDIPGAWKKSVDYLNKIIAVEPSNGQARLLQAKNYMDNKEFDKAIKEYEFVNSLYPNGQALKLMATAKMYLKDIDGAKRDLKEYIKYNPNDNAAKSILSALEDGQISYSIGK